MNEELLLLQKAKGLDPDALAQIHDQYYAKIFKFIAYRVGDRDLAEDLTSEVFMRLLSALREKSAPANTLQGWLFAVAGYVVKDHFRQVYRMETAVLDENIPHDDATPAEKLEEMVTEDRLVNAVGQLTEDQRDVIAFRFGWGMSLKAVAAKMDRSLGSVKMLQARAIHALSDRLQGAGEVGHG